MIKGAGQKDSSAAPFACGYSAGAAVASAEADSSSIMAGLQFGQRFLPSSTTASARVCAAAPVICPQADFAW